MNINLIILNKYTSKKKIILMFMLILAVKIIYNKIINNNFNSKQVIKFVINSTINMNNI